MVAVMVRKGVCWLALAVLVSLPVSVWAGGSFALEDLRPILQQQPVLAQWLTGGLDFDETGGYAIRIGQNVNPRFGGLRVGPYVILAKPKGASGPFALEVTVETELICLNAAGKPVEVSEAQTIREKFSSVTVNPYKESQ